MLQAGAYPPSGSCTFRPCGPASGRNLSGRRAADLVGDPSAPVVNIISMSATSSEYSGVIASNSRAPDGSCSSRRPSSAVIAFSSGWRLRNACGTLGRTSKRPSLCGEGSREHGRPSTAALYLPLYRRFAKAESLQAWLGSIGQLLTGTPKPLGLRNHKASIGTALLWLNIRSIAEA